MTDSEENCRSCSNPAYSVFFSPNLKTVMLWNRYCLDCFHQAWLKSPGDFEQNVLDYIANLQDENNRLDGQLRKLREEKQAAEEELKDFLNHCICESARRFIDDSATTPQINFLKSLAKKHSKDLDQEISGKFDGIGIENLTKEQAGELITAWNK